MDNPHHYSKQQNSIGVAIPELEGKLDGMALRVPVSNGSVIDMVLTLKKDVTKEEVNNALKEASQANLKGIMAYTEGFHLCHLILLGNHVLLLLMASGPMVLGNKSNIIKVFMFDC